MQWEFSLSKALSLGQFQIYIFTYFINLYQVNYYKRINSQTNRAKIYRTHETMILTPGTLLDTLATMDYNYFSICLSLFFARKTF